MSYDIPYDAQPKDGLHSPAYRKFYENFFLDATGLIRHEVDPDFINALTPQETELAKDMIRRNLKLAIQVLIYRTQKSTTSCAEAMRSS